MIEFIKENWISLSAALLAVYPVIVTTYQYFDNRWWERRWKKFEVYHKLIEIVNNVNGDLGLSVQRAAVYELEYFKSYYPLTLKILKAQLGFWENKEVNSELLKDMKALVNDIEKHKQKHHLWHNLNTLLTSARRRKF